MPDSLQDDDASVAVASLVTAAEEESSLLTYDRQWKDLYKELCCREDVNIDKVLLMEAGGPVRLARSLPGAGCSTLADTAGSSAPVCPAWPHLLSCCPLKRST